jgi:single-strand DNA-binding protein
VIDDGGDDMADFNNVVIVGRLTRDPELRYASSGAPVCSFSVATSRKYTKQDGQKAESTTFVDVDVWRRMAEICAQFLKKGREVLVMGSLLQDRWVDAKTQQNRSKIKLLAQQVRFLGPRPQDAQDGAETPDEVAEVPTEVKE